MNIIVWNNFSKRKNSTKQPTAGTTISNVNLKENTSIEKPTFVLNSNDFTINYVQAFGHYYFVDDIKSVRNGIIEINCSQDVLATYKSAITGSSQYIERADMGSSYVCTVPDPLNPPTDEVEISVTDIINLGWAGNPTLILGAVSTQGVVFYSMDEARLKLILDGVFNNSFSQNVQNQYYGIREFLISLKKVPYTPAGTTGPVVFGQYDTQDSATVVADSIIHDNASVLVQFPSVNHLNTGNYCDFAPYTSCAVYLPYVGVVPVDAYVLGNNKTLTVDYWLDQKTADIVYKLTAGGVTLGTFSGNCGANLPIATQHYNAVGLVSAALTTVGGAITGNPALAAAGTIASFNDLSWHSQVNGTLSSFIGNSVGTMVKAFVITKVPETWNLNQHTSRNGVPVQDYRALSGLSGYVKCKDASVPVAGFDRDRTEIESFMNGGFYIE